MYGVRVVMNRFSTQDVKDLSALVTTYSPPLPFGCLLNLDPIAKAYKTISGTASATLGIQVVFTASGIGSC